MVSAAVAEERFWRPLQPCPVELGAGATPSL